MQHIHHVVVIGILVLIYLKHLLGIALNLCLVKHAEHLLKPVVHVAMQKRYLHNDAVVGKTLHERLFMAVDYDVSVIVEHVMIDIHYRLLDVAHLVAEQIYSNHGVGKAFFIRLAYVILVAILRTKILSETQRLGVEPRLLQLNKHNAVFYDIAFALTYSCSKVDAKH